MKFHIVRAKIPANSSEVRPIDLKSCKPSVHHVKQSIHRNPVDVFYFSVCEYPARVVEVHAFGRDKSKRVTLIDALKKQTR